jgi:hypothetical protein
VDVLIAKGDLEAAEVELGPLIAAGTNATIDTSWALGLDAALHLSRGEAAEGARLAAEAVALGRAAGSFNPRYTFVTRTHIGGLIAAADREAARAVLRAAREDVLSRATAIEEAHYRASFLERVPDNVWIVDLARAWLTESAGGPQGATE